MRADGLGLSNVDSIYWSASHKKYFLLKYKNINSLIIYIYIYIYIYILEETILYFLLKCFFQHPFKFLYGPHQFQNLIFIT